MYVAIFFQDLPGTSKGRQEVVADHRRYMREWANKILAAGSTYTDDGTVVKGGSIIMEVQNVKEARLFVENDPFTSAGLRAFTEIRPWIRAVFDGRLEI